MTYRDPRNAMMGDSAGQHVELVFKNCSLAGQSIPLPPPPSSVVLGRDPTCDIRFDADQDRVVGRRHARIDNRVDGVYLTDLNSRNGTFLQSRPVQGEVALRNGETVQLGEGGPLVVVVLTDGGMTERTTVLRPKSRGAGPAQPAQPAARGTTTPGGAGYGAAGGDPRMDPGRGQPGPGPGGAWRGQEPAGRGADPGSRGGAPDPVRRGPNEPAGRADPRRSGSQSGRASFVDLEDPMDSMRSMLDKRSPFARQQPAPTEFDDSSVLRDLGSGRFQNSLIDLDDDAEVVDLKGKGAKGRGRAEEPVRAESLLGPSKAAGARSDRADPGLDRGADPYARSAGPYARGADPSGRGADPYARGADPSGRGGDPSGRGASADPYGARAADPYARGASADPYAARNTDPSGRGASADPYAARSADPYGARPADPAGRGAAAADPYAAWNPDPYAGRGADPYAGRAGADPGGGRGPKDPYASADPYAGASADPYGARNADPYGGRGADPYGGRGGGDAPGRGADPYGAQGGAADPYARGGTADPYAGRGADPAGRGAADPYARGGVADPYARGGAADPYAGRGADPSGRGASDPYARGGAAEPYTGRGAASEPPAWGAAPVADPKADPYGGRGAGAGRPAGPEPFGGAAVDPYAQRGAAGDAWARAGLEPAAPAAPVDAFPIGRGGAVDPASAGRGGLDSVRPFPATGAAAGAGAVGAGAAPVGRGDAFSPGGDAAFRGAESFPPAGRTGQVGGGVFPPAPGVDADSGVVPEGRRRGREREEEEAAETPAKKLSYFRWTPERTAYAIQIGIIFALFLVGCLGGMAVAFVSPPSLSAPAASAPE